jgi:hypothetical protein
MGSYDARENVSSMPSPSSAPLALRAPGTADPLDDVALQKLWLATQSRPWRSLAVVPSGAEVDTLAVATLLAKIAWSYHRQPTAVLDLRDLTLRMVEHRLRELGEQLAHGERVFIALRAVSQNPTTIAVTRMSDAAVLCVRLGDSLIRTANSTVEEIGREKFLGSVLVRNKGEAA